MLVGTLAAPITGSVLLPLVYGMRSVDSASAWGLAPLAHIIVAVLCVPAFWVVYASVLSLMKSRLPDTGRLERRRWLGVLLGLLAYGAVLVLVWSLVGIGGVTITG